MDYNHLAVKAFNLNAEKYQDKLMYVDLYNDVLDIFCEHVPEENANILDVACGPGNITRYVLEKRPGFRILGIDLSENMLALAQKNNPAAEFRLMDARKIDTLNDTYDGIICGFCMPYLSKEEALEFITHSAALLRPGGVVYISTMEDDYSKSGLLTAPSGNEVYMYYHEAGYLREALEEKGFTIIELRRQDFPAELGPPATDLIIIAQKKKTG